MNNPGSAFNLHTIVDAMDGFSGAELERVVIVGLCAAVPSKDKRLTTDHLLQAARQRIPLSRSHKADIEQARAWAETNARPAAMPPEDQAQALGDDAAQRRQRRIDF